MQLVGTRHRRQFGGGSTSISDNRFYQLLQDNVWLLMVEFSVWGEQADAKLTS